MSAAVAIQRWHRRALQAMLGGATLTRHTSRDGPMSWWFDQGNHLVNSSANLHGTSWNWLERKGLIERVNTVVDPKYGEVHHYAVTAAGLAAAMNEVEP